MVPGRVRLIVHVGHVLHFALYSVLDPARKWEALVLAKARGLKN